MAVMGPVSCSHCGNSLSRVLWNYGKNRPIKEFFCDNVCKGTWQQAQRESLGFTKEWLIEQYIVLGRDANQIAQDIGRNSKRVWEWIRAYGIPTRPRGTNHTQLPKDGSTFRGRTHTQKTKEAIRELRLIDGHVPYLKNGVHWLKTTDSVHPCWKGGCTPERQAFYASDKWKQCVKSVWKRDNAICQKCGLDHRSVRSGVRFHIHHIDSFCLKTRRAVLSNLVLLCRPCHLWVHSSANVNREFLGKGHFRKGVKRHVSFETKSR